MGGAPIAAELLALAERVARAAGAELLRRQGDAHLVQAKSSDTDPVSEADRASERLLVDTILAARPGDGVLGEEGADRAGSSGIRWVLDPLDGTVNYLYGLASWCVSVAAEDDRGALIGVVHDPLRDETFTASRGSGSQLNGRSIAVNDPVAFERALIATGFGYEPADRRRQAATVARLLPVVRDIRRAGSAALDLCAVAAGRVDGFYEDTVSRWDWAAGALIAAEAGAVVSHFAEPGIGIIAAGPALHAKLRASVGDAQGDRGVGS